MDVDNVVLWRWRWARALRHGGTDRLVVKIRNRLAEVDPEGLETHGDFVVVVKDGVCECGGVDAKEEHVDDDIAGTEIGG